ncbi:MAG: TrkH family potassium uptake protein [Calditrichaceae bacterium]|nr:TrkH family potassium uptake protein [Calditrichaceae bacterium]MBN2708194.1 TrkH family potassium uptake protein [Calditrichaceae bacterium]RQV97386.1 MAG: TrkH family potassium uptake protein [Calditrichota bacterium]
MRLHIVLRYVALALLLNAVFLFLSAIISLVSGDDAFFPLLYSGLVTLLFGLFPLVFVPATTHITNKEGLLIVVLSWLLSCLVGSLPYLLWGGVFTFTNAWFESVSGFTTTGSTILIDIEALPASLLFWRAATHWIGGIGIIIFVLAVLPFVGVAEVVLFRSEISSMVQQNFHHRARRAIQILTGVYIGLTFTEIIALWISGMSPFDAVTHSFATIATGGFSPKNASIAFYNSPVIETIIILFMILSGIHFALIFSVFKGEVSLLWKSTVLRFYFAFICAGVLFGALDLYLLEDLQFMTALRHAAFNIISVGTSTGFATTDTSIWPPFSQLILIFFTLQCACSGSTSGGIKVDRIAILLKSFIRQIKLVMHPKAIIPIRIDNKAINNDVASKSITFIMVYLIIVFISTLLLSVLDIDILAAFSGTIAAMGNVGPGLGSVGSVGNFAHIPIIGKWVLTVVMLLGRLEIYALFIFITPAQWKDSITY